MPVHFFSNPIQNSPYERPNRHWQLDGEGQPTDRLIDERRPSQLISPVPKPKRRPADEKQGVLLFDGLSSQEQQYDTSAFINEIRHQVETWRALPSPGQWQVTPVTARLLQHWRHHPFQGLRPFFCQVEAVETIIWLTEVAPKLGKRGQKYLQLLERASHDANPGLYRLALKLATGTGKTTVMAMLIAWQTVNAVRYPRSPGFSRGFLIVTPGITIRDRLWVLLPNDPDSYYRSRELLPNDLLPDLDRAKIVITNYHSFKLKERLALSRVGRALLRGHGQPLRTTESVGQMIQRAMPALMGLKNIVILNDEAHHCYREKPDDRPAGRLKGDEREEAQKNNEAARLWISGIEAIQKAGKMAVRAIYDLSATPFFLTGSGYDEGTLFPWTVCDFSLMDAIESGIVKLPRVPVADNVPSGDMPKFRNLWHHIGTKMPKKGRGKTAKGLDPLKLPAELQTALYVLYGHYEKTFALWEKAGTETPPVFIIVCNNTATSKLVYDFVSGFHYEGADGERSPLQRGRLELFQNHDEHGNRLPRPNTLLIDSEQLESGEALDKDFRAMAADEIDRFRREIIERGDGGRAAESIDDAALLREVMNTVGKPGRLGAAIRCVVSVSMLTEGWDANTVTHILGIRAFGTQLLCEQVIGRALRRQCYDLNAENRFNVEYADVFGIPFDFTAQSIRVEPPPPRETVRVHAVRPERDGLEIVFPRVEGYRLHRLDGDLTARFDDDSILELTPDLVGPSITENRGIIGEGVELTVEHLGAVRRSSLVFHLAKHLLLFKFRDPGQEPEWHLFGRLRRIVRQWLDGGFLRCTGGTHPAQLVYQEIADMACERIAAGLQASMGDKNPLRAILDPYNPTGSSASVHFTTSKKRRWKTDPGKCQVNWVICDSEWEAEFCRVAESHPRVLAYVKNQNLGFEVPYRLGSGHHVYRPDFILKLDDGRDDPLNLIVEIKGYRREDAKEKANTMRNYWIPGVNHLRDQGRWAFAELRELFEIESKFFELVESFVAGEAGKPPPRATDATTGPDR